MPPTIEYFVGDKTRSSGFTGRNSNGGVQMLIFFDNLTCGVWMIDSFCFCQKLRVGYDPECYYFSIVCLAFIFMLLVLLVRLDTHIIVF